MLDSRLRLDSWESGVVMASIVLSCLSPARAENELENKASQSPGNGQPTGEEANGGYETWPIEI